MTAARLAAVALLAAALTAAAADPIDPVGYPKKAGDGGFGAFRVWFEGGKWHLRTSTEGSDGKRDKILAFTGVVRSEDKMEVTAVKLEGKQNGKGKGDAFVMHRDGKGFDFRFTTYGAADQVDIGLGKQSRTIAFAFKLDGEKADNTRVFVGAGSKSPDKSDFSLPAVPDKK